MTPLPPLRPSDAENLAGQDTGRDHLSHSSLTTFLNCARRYELDKVDRLELVDRPKPLALGSAFQKAIELQDPDAGASLLRDEAVITAQEQEDKLRVDETTVRAAARLYLDRWPAATNEQREYEYRVRLRNPWTGHGSRTFDLLGYADGIEDDGAWITLTENKFVGQITAVNVKRLPLDRQVSLACYGLWRATGKRVAKVNYRFVRKPTIKQRKGETLDQYLTRLADDYADPERRDFYTQQETVFRTDDDLLRIEAELWVWAEQLREQRRAALFPRNSSHCNDFGGCPYIPICIGDPDAEHLYRVREPHVPTTTPEEVAA